MKNNPFLQDNSIIRVASLNNFVLSDLQQETKFTEYKGKTAGETLRTAVLVEKIKQNLTRLKLENLKIPDISLPTYLEKCLSTRGIIQQVAEEIITTYGELFGFFLVNLFKGDEFSRQQRPEWTDEHWDFWKTRENIVLAGGLANGKLGSFIKKHAEKTLNSFQLNQIKLYLTNNSLILPLAGAACLAPSGSETILSFDFGHSNIKRAVFRNDHHKTKLKTLLEPVLIDKNKNLTPEVFYRGEGKKIYQFILDILLSTITKLEKEGITQIDCINISIANYLEKDHVVERGYYGHLSLFTKDLKTSLQNDLNKKLKRSIPLRLIHDGTAAAACFTKLPNSAVIILGSFLGIGFPDVNPELLDVDPELVKFI
ncbi:MAG: hypothetical protein MJB14_11865 [Spirochaetes bacterium]|nr:hypothetical protein [Spirochaetota bacterium]